MGKYEYVQLNTTAKYVLCEMQQDVDQKSCEIVQLKENDI